MVAQADRHAPFARTDAQRDRATIWRVLHGIGEQVPDHLLQPALIPAPRNFRRRSQRKVVPFVVTWMPAIIVETSRRRSIGAALVLKPARFDLRQVKQQGQELGESVGLADDRVQSRRPACRGCCVSRAGCFVGAIAPRS